MLLATATAGGSGVATARIATATATARIATALLLLVAATGDLHGVAADRSRSRYRPPGWKEVKILNIQLKKKKSNLKCPN